MSTQTLSAALDFVPEAKTGRGGNVGIRSTVSKVIEALFAARQAEAEYRRQVARGIDPATAAGKVFRCDQKAA